MKPRRKYWNLVATKKRNGSTERKLHLLRLYALTESAGVHCAGRCSSTICHSHTLSPSDTHSLSITMPTNELIASRNLLIEFQIIKFLFEKCEKLLKFEKYECIFSTIITQEWQISTKLEFDIPTKTRIKWGVSNLIEFFNKLQ